MEINRQQEIRIAIRSGDDIRAIELIDSDVSELIRITPFGTWLHVASCFGRDAVVRFLLAKHVDINIKSGTFGGGAINEASTRGHAHVVRILLDAEAKLDVAEPERNPLFGAILSGSIEIVKMLIEHGIDWRVKYSGKSMKNMDAFAFARERGQIQIAEYLENQLSESLTTTLTSKRAEQS